MAASRYWLVRRARHIRAVVVSALALRQVHATETPASQHDGEGRDDEQWFFSVVDIIAALTDSEAPTKYWTAMKRREETASGFQLSTICRQLKLTSSDGKTYKTDCVNTEAPSLPTSCETLLFMEVMSLEGEIGVDDVGVGAGACRRPWSGTERLAAHRRGCLTRSWSSVRSGDGHRGVQVAGFA